MTGPEDVWQDRAACYGMEDVFITDAPDLSKSAPICARCPVRAACADTGATGKEWGVWGGQLLRSGRPVEKARVAL